MSPLRFSRCLSLSLIASLSMFSLAETTQKPTELLQWIQQSVTADAVKAQINWQGNEKRAEKLSAMLAEEATAYEIENQLVRPWQQALLTKNNKSFESLLTDKFQAQQWNSKAKSKDMSLYVQQTWSGGKTSPSKEFLTGLFADFKAIEDVSLDFVAMDPGPSSQQAALKIRFDIRGTDVNGARRNDRGLFGVTADKTGDTWKMSRLNLISGETLTAKTSFFQEGTSQARLDKLPVLTRHEAIRRGGFALSLADYNNDGVLDMFYGNEGASELYTGKADGTFVKNTKTELKSEKSVKTAIFTDLDNDGWQDLVLAKFIPENTQSITVFRNKNGVFKKEAYTPENSAPDYPMPAAAGDFNNDGYMDFYIGYPGVRDFTHLTSSAGKKGFPHGVYINDAKGKLAAGPVPAFLKDAGRTNMDYPIAMFPHSAIAVDYDNDGRQDIIVMDDRGGLSPVFKNMGDGTFKENAEQIGLSNTGYGMGTAVADFDRDGFMDVAMTNVDFDAGIRMRHAGTQRFKNAGFASKFAKGIILFRNNGKGKFEPVTEKANLDWIGLGAGSAEFIDFDNDGWQDLYVVNGLWSGTLRNEDLSSYFVRSVMSGIDLDRPSLDFTRSAYWNLLTGLNSGVFNKEVKGRVSMAGYQRNRLFRNNQNGSFTELGYLAGVDSLADGYVAAKADLNKDGKMDLFLRNADPGTKEYRFPAVQAFINNTPTANQSVIVSLEGSKSNRDGIGTKVTAHLGKAKITQELVANNGAAQGQKVLHFGLGSASQIDTLEVQWPSGQKSVMTNLKPGYVLVKENQLQFGSLTR